MRSKKRKAILLIILSALSFAMMSVMVKLAGDNIPSMQKAFFRNLVVTIVVLTIFIVKKEKYRVERKNIPVLAVRAIAGTLGIIFYYFSIDKLPLADASLLNKLSPFFLIILSLIILKEKVNIYQGFAVVLAFLGAMLVIGPAFKGDVLPYFVGVGGALFAATAYLCVRILGNRGVPSKITVITFSATSTLILSIYVIFNFTPMNLNETLFLLGAGVFAMFGQITLTNAYALAKARDVTVYNYTQIIFAGILGMIFFSEMPMPLNVIGYVVIIMAAVISGYRPARKVETN